MTDVFADAPTTIQMGGGVWVCPTGSGTVHVTDGLAIFDNQATGNAAVGDDLVTLSMSYSEASATVDSRMLGGGLNAFYTDGGIVHQNGGDFRGNWLPDGTARYDASNPGDQVTLDGSSQLRALKNVPSDSVKAAAEDEAGVVISGNEATYGGGIAANDILLSGKADKD